MKFICKDCGKEFNSKVEYCDCGNNTFNIVDDTPTIAKKPKSTIEKKPIDKSNVISWGIFSMCILLSLLIIFFAWNPQKSTSTKKVHKQLQKVENIPNLDTFWDNTPVKVTPKAPTPVQQPAPQKVKTIQIEEPPFVSQLFNKPTTSYNVQPKVVQTPIIFKPVKKNTAVKKVKPKAKPVTAKPIIRVSTPHTTNVVKAPTVSAPKAQETSRIDYQATSNYNSALLRRLYSKFVVGGLSGSGSCTVSFSVSDNGKLLNRKFVRMSDNKSLNDAVYYMLMSVPTFSAPPDGYNNTTLRVRVNFANGEFEIGYI
ncbi:MAG: TonB C-terminal domain-containing protein [Clostridiaceae bacterium]|jgi:outer membrane biosynthesis protein TonB|nr:TonB C-terminal domain-containing protein [Clostridiaceae bacterium]